MATTKLKLALVVATLLIMGINHCDATPPKSIECPEGEISISGICVLVQKLKPKPQPKPNFCHYPVMKTHPLCRSTQLPTGP